LGHFRPLIFGIAGGDRALNEMGDVVAQLLSLDALPNARQPPSAVR